MLTNNQLNQLEADLWASTTNPQCYMLLRDNKALREALNNLIGATYAVLSENYPQLQQSPKLHKLEETLTMLEEQMQ